MIVNLKLAAKGGRGAKEASSVVDAVMRAVADGGLNPSKTRVAADWIQYRQNFRAPAATPQSFSSNEGSRLFDNQAGIDRETVSINIP